MTPSTPHHNAALIAQQTGVRPLPLHAGEVYEMSRTRAHALLWLRDALSALGVLALFAVVLVPALAVLGR